MRSEVEINAPPARVWKILQDLDGYQSWNPFLIHAKGKLRPGENVDLVMKPVGKSAQEFSPKVLEVEDERHICWRGRLLIPLLYLAPSAFLTERHQKLRPVIAATRNEIAAH